MKKKSLFTILGLVTLPIMPLIAASCTETKKDGGGQQGGGNQQGGGQQGGGNQQGGSQQGGGQQEDVITYPENIKSLDELSKYGNNLLNVLVKDQAKVLEKISKGEKLFYSFSKNMLAFNSKRPRRDDWETLEYVISLKTKIRRGLQLGSSKSPVDDKNRINSELEYNFDQETKILTIKYKLIEYKGKNAPSVSEQAFESKIKLDKTEDEKINIKPSEKKDDKKAKANRTETSAPVLDPRHSLKYDSGNDFYKSLNGLKGDELRNKLFQIQEAHRNENHEYSDLFNTYKDAFVDKYYENDGTVLDIYGENIKESDPFVFKHGEFRDKGKKEGEGMNREHLVPQSWWGSENLMRIDAHHVWPTDKKVNELHGNLPYGTVTNAHYTSKNGTLVGVSEEDGKDVCEVIDEFKGDVARAYLYFALTYRDKDLAQNKNAQRFFEQKNGVYSIKANFLGTMLKWAYKDNISQFDLDRNNAIYKHQTNRNPFIDYPELIKVYFENDNNFVFKNKGVAVSLEEIN
ncbi:endonuclease [Mycoplasma phocoeninasale]|nr:endonuclease [Mycoplasma phocoeninasale]